MTRSRRPPFRESPSDSGDAKIETAQRLQKVLAAAGLGSRRDCEELITEGRVEIDRQVVTELGTKVDPLQQEIRVDGVVLHRPKRLYYAVNKPPGVMSTNFDPSGRTRVIDLVPTEERLFPVGRLDRASEGLILVTNDGELANRITHPRYGVEKTYHVRVEGVPSSEQLLRLRRGIHIAEGVARVESVKIKRRHKNVSDLEIVLREGKNREIRRILAKIGHKVLWLKRTSVGPVKLGELKLGAWRKLMPQEIEALFEAARQRRREGKRGRKGPGTRDQGPGVGNRERGTGNRGENAERGTRNAEGKSPETISNPQSAIRNPQSAIAGAPPKIDLATLLNPALAPKQPMAIVPPPAAAAGPAIGDVISYEADDQASLPPLQTPAKKRRRPLREYETDSEPIERLGEEGPGNREKGKGERELGNRKSRIFEGQRDRGQRSRSSQSAIRNPKSTISRPRDLAGEDENARERRPGKGAAGKARRAAKKQAIASRPAGRTRQGGGRPVGKPFGKRSGKKSGKRRGK